tara:strand:- start:62 stop:571 length:510 start_codon:yes stop_codon:yes gene_type:complete
MKNYIYLSLLVIFSLIANSVNAGTLSEDAFERGINSNCASYLSQIEKSYDLDGGLNITFAHPSESSVYPSLHISTKHYNNGSSSFSATLTPDNDYCYLSTVVVTAINNQSCEEITSLKKEENSSFNSTTFADGAFTIVTPSDNSYQIIFSTSGENSCMMTETRMLWPGR